MPFLNLSWFISNESRGLRLKRLYTFKEFAHFILNMSFKELNIFLYFVVRCNAFLNWKLVYAPVFVQDLYPDEEQVHEVVKLTRRVDELFVKPVGHQWLR